jgi:diguanylate cyclase (GGDEF)-like protein/PAS domain S-box-containing protein
MSEINNTQNLEFLVNNIDALIYVIDVNSYKVLYSNDKCKEEFGDIDNKICFEVLETNRNSPCENCSLCYSKELNEGDSYKWEHNNSKNGKTYFFNEKVIKWDNDTLAKVQIGIDITRQKDLENRIHSVKDENIKTFEAFTDSTIEALLIYNEDKKCINANKVAPELLGYTKEELIGMSAFEFIAPESLKYVSKVINKQNKEPYEAIMKRKDGSKFPAILRGKDIPLNNKTIRVSAVLDITKIKEKEEEISKLAYYDTLTNLPNRLLLNDRLNQLLKKTQRDSKYGILLFVDLDNFKNVNDTKGHMVGDQLLIQTARRLEKIVRRSDTVARFGGDEFILLLDTNTQEESIAMFDAQTIAEKILSQLKETFFINKYEFSLTASLGIVLFNNSKNPAEELMKYADTAMYDAKERGRNKYAFFDPALQSDIERKALLTDKLKKAIENKSIKLNYQIQVDTNKKIKGVEALARWIDEELGFISPMEFIPVAEDSGLIIEMGNYIIDETFSLLSKWKDDPIKSDWRISVNISLIQFEKRGFASYIGEKIKEYDINPRNVRLELTESLLLNDAQLALEKINKLKKLGVTLSIDDFGTGYSSLSYLKKLPVDELKIDKSFVQDIVIDENDETIINVILSLGRKFGFEVIAEGVENKDIHDKLSSLGCEYFQGYYHGYPVTKDKL